MEIALVIVILVLVIALLVLLLRRKPSVSESASPAQLLSEPLQQLGALKSQIESISSAQANLPNSFKSLETALRGLETKVVETTGAVKESVIKDSQEAKQGLQALRIELEARKPFEKELQDSVRRVEAVIAGSRSRGQAGEDILAESFKQFPPEIIETNFRIKGRIVEYALILADGKRIPIDSKWTKPELIERLAVEDDPLVRGELSNQIQDALKDKVKEVTKYIDPSITVSWGIAAIPDSVYNLCKREHLDAFKQNVVIMPYSLAVIYLLSLYHLHRQYCRSVDVEKLAGYLDQIERGLETIDKELENKIFKGATTIQNAFGECKRIVGDLRGATAYLRAIPSGSEAKPVESGVADNHHG